MQLYTSVESQILHGFFIVTTKKNRNNQSVRDLASYIANLPNIILPITFYSEFAKLSHYQSFPPYGMLF